MKCMFCGRSPQKLGKANFVYPGLCRECHTEYGSGEVFTLKLPITMLMDIRRSLLELEEARKENTRYARNFHTLATVDHALGVAIVNLAMVLFAHEHQDLLPKGEEEYATSRL